MLLKHLHVATEATLAQLLGEEGASGAPEVVGLLQAAATG